MPSPTSACRLLRARLPRDRPPSGEWRPLADLRRRRTPATELLLPVCRVALAGGEAWACVLPRGGAAHEWVLVEPPAMRLSGDDATLGGDVPPWLWRSFRADRRWRRRLPLGTSDDVECCAAVDARWRALDEATEGDPTKAFRREAHAGQLREGQPVLWNGGWLQLHRLDPAAVDSYAWIDPAARAAFLGVAGSKEVWGLAWLLGAVLVPLAVVRPGGLLRPARIVHLVPGAPEERLPA